jgi:hypothetical protein
MSIVLKHVPLGLSRAAALLTLWLGTGGAAFATPANRAALEHHYDRFLAKELNRCTTCHLPSARRVSAQRVWQTPARAR